MDTKQHWSQKNQTFIFLWTKIVHLRRWWQGRGRERPVT